VRGPLPRLGQALFLAIYTILLLHTGLPSLLVQLYRAPFRPAHPSQTKAGENRAGRKLTLA